MKKTILLLSVASQGPLLAQALLQLDWEPPAGIVYAASYAEAAGMLPG